MIWLPARFVAGIVDSMAPHPIDPEEHPAVRTYLREFLEAVIRVRAGDARLLKRHDAVELVARYDALPLDEVFQNLRTMNRSLEGDDLRRDPPETYGSQQAWEPLARTRAWAEAALDAALYAEMVDDRSSSLSELRAGREVVEAIVAVSCCDARRAYLTTSERSELLRLASDAPTVILDAYARLNRVAVRLGVDEWIRLDPFLATRPDED